MTPAAQITADLIRYLIHIATDPTQGTTRRQAATTQATTLDTEMTVNALIALAMSLGERLEQEGIDWRQGMGEWIP